MPKLLWLLVVIALLASGAAAGYAAESGVSNSSIEGAPLPPAPPRADASVATPPWSGERATTASLVQSGRSAAMTIRRQQLARLASTELPGGGDVLFPGRRLVALYGHPYAPVLGVLGEQSLPASIARAKRLAASYEKVSDVPAVPAFELITTVASRSAGSDGNYSNEKKVRDIRPWVVAAGKAGVYVVLDLQPGRSDFLTQAKRYESLLAFPHVGLALDPEWRLKPGQVHLRQIGSVSAREVNQVTTWLADLTARRGLPQKLLLLHQFRLAMITDRERLVADRKEVAVVIQMDGFGAPSTKMTTWRVIRADAPKGIRFGWKNFYDEDRPTFTPGRTASVRPSPVFVSYQ